MNGPTLEQLARRIHFANRMLKKEDIDPMTEEVMKHQITRNERFIIEKVLEMYPDDTNKTIF